MIYGVILPQNEQIFCRRFTMVEHLTAISRETIAKWRIATIVSKKKYLYTDAKCSILYKFTVVPFGV
jgi:hypothetical protein